MCETFDQHCSSLFHDWPHPDTIQGEIFMEFCKYNNEFVQKYSHDQKRTTSIQQWIIVHK